MTADKEVKSIFPGDDPWGELDEYESRNKMQLAEMQKEFQMRAKPLIDTLVRIERMRPPRPIVIDVSMIDPDMLAQLQRKAGER
ncbi:hypothetical protein [Pseudomonas sp.]|uniref:hypothetical protein n=1 Tax=Pseudomonas sp. TaxID=306 RepID=UPI003FD8785D